MFRRRLFVVASTALAAAGCAEPTARPSPRAATATPRRARRTPPDDPAALARALVAGTFRLQECDPERLAAAAGVLFEGLDWSERELFDLDRFRLLREMGPVGAAAIKDVICRMGDTEATEIAARATLDAIDPDRTRRIEPLVERLGRHDSVKRALWDLGPCVIPRLAAHLDGDSEEGRGDAAETLEQFGVAAADALPSLRRAAAGSDWAAVRAARATFRVSGGDEAPVPAILPALLADEDLRGDVFRAQPSIVADTTAVLHCDGEGWRYLAARLLVRVAPDTDGVAEEFAEHAWVEDRDEAEEALKALAALGGRATTVLPRIVPWLAPKGERSWSTWYGAWHAALEAVVASGDRDVALPAIRAAFAVESDEWRRFGLAEALVGFGAENADVLVGPLGDDLFVEFTARVGHYHDEHRVGKWASAELLGALGESASSAVPALIRAMAPPSSICDAAVNTLARIGTPAVGPLREALNLSEVPQVRVGAARALGSMGARARAAESELAHALSDENVLVRGAAATALLQVAPSVEAAAVLGEALASSEDSDRFEWLKALGPDQAVALPAVRVAQRDADPDVRLAASTAERKITGDPRALVAEIGASLASETPLLGVQAARDLGPSAAPFAKAIGAYLDKGVSDELVVRALAAIGPGARDAAPALARAVARTSDSSLSHVCKAIEAVGPAADAAVPALVARLERTCRSWNEIALLDALAAIGPAAAPALPQVRLRLRSYDRPTRDAARIALERIEVE